MSALPSMLAAHMAFLVLQLDAGCVDPCNHLGTWQQHRHPVHVILQAWAGGNLVSCHLQQQINTLFMFPLAWRAVTSCYAPWGHCSSVDGPAWPTPLASWPVSSPPSSSALRGTSCSSAMVIVLVLLYQYLQTTLLCCTEIRKWSPAPKNNGASLRHMTSHVLPFLVDQHERWLSG